MTFNALRAEVEKGKSNTQAAGAAPGGYLPPVLAMPLEGGGDDEEEVTIGLGSASKLSASV